MVKECEYFYKCKQVSNYRNKLKQKDKKPLDYVINTCLKGGDDLCIKEQKSLDRKIN